MRIREECLFLNVLKFANVDKLDTDFFTKLTSSQCLWQDFSCPPPPISKLANPNAPCCGPQAS